MRNLDSTMAARLATGQIGVIFLVTLTFATDTRFIWSGVGDFEYNGDTYTGVGSLGSIGDVSGGNAVYAQGTSLTLSGIDPILLAECLTDILIGAPAKIMFALVNSSLQIIGVPYMLYAGTVDTPSIKMGTDAASITLNIENAMVDLQRAQQQRYTAADQHIKFPNDIGFNWVEQLNDVALLWG